MRKLTIFLLAVSVFFVACETDFEVNTYWKEVTVVYGLLDQSQQQQYIKINKAYLGEGDALQMASVADSVNYNPADIEVKIFKVKEGDTLGFVTLYDTILEKDSGLFATDENIIYTTPSNFFLTNNADEKDYILSIINKKSGKEVWGKTHLIHALALDIPPSKPMGFYGTIPNPLVLPLEKSQTTVNWRHSENGKIYQIIARVHYTNFFHNDTVSTYVDWDQPQMEFDGSTEMHYTFDGDDFVNALENKITDKESVPKLVPLSDNDTTLVARRLLNIELLFTVSSEDLQTYMALNEPFEGIVQERPVFTNINNGIGLFSCRYNKSHSMSFPSSTREGVSIDLESLHFVYP